MRRSGLAILAVVVIAVIVLLAASGIFSVNEESAESTPTSGQASGTEGGEREADAEPASASGESGATNEADRGQASLTAGGGEDTEAGDLETGGTGEGSGVTAASVGDSGPALPGAESASGVATPGRSEAGDDDPELQREAESFVAELAQPSDEPLSVERLDTFVTPDRPLSPDIVETEAGEVAEPGPQTEARADAPGDAPAETGAGTRVAGGDATPQSVAAAAGPGAEAADAGSETASQPTAVDLPLSEETPVTIAEILGAEEVIPSDAVFYVHTVRPDDDQGIWGIVHDGIVDNFAEGVAMRRGGTAETYRVDIPTDADELRADASSSFLGRLIYEKSRQSYVYNYQTERVGRNPDFILPGQEIVIVSFTPDELIAIYKHFAGRQEGN